MYFLPYLYLMKKNRSKQMKDIKRYKCEFLNKNKQNERKIWFNKNEQVRKSEMWIKAARPNIILFYFKINISKYFM